MTDFELFKKEFKKWQQKFGLTGYKVYFKQEPMDDCFADTSINIGEMLAAVKLNSNLPAKDKPFKHIKLSAKHEALHLLIGRLQGNGCYRYATETEIYEATEELVFKLEDLIPG